MPSDVLAVWFRDKKFTILVYDSEKYDTEYSVLYDDDYDEVLFNDLHRMIELWKITKFAGLTLADFLNRTS